MYPSELIFTLFQLVQKLAQKTSTKKPAEAGFQKRQRLCRLWVAHIM